MTRAIGHVLQAVLPPFLVVVAIAVGLLLATLVVQRAVREILYRRRIRLSRRYGIFIDAIVEGAGHRDALESLGRAPRRHRRLIGNLLLAPLRSLAGEPVARARDAARSLDMVATWMADLSGRRWWRRAEAARALGLIAEPSAYDLIVQTLDDPHEEVRAAAVDALGRLGDVRAAAELLARLSAQSRHQRVRIVEALRELGRNAGSPVLAFAQAHTESLPLLVNLLVMTVGAGAVTDLVAWSRHDRPEVRAAALHALGMIGVDERVYYHALKALGDTDPHVRAMAARAVGRSGRADAVPYLTTHLNDDWSVAAESARGLRELSTAGLRALNARASGDGQAAELARHMLWEVEARRAREGWMGGAAPFPRLAGGRG